MAPEALAKALSGLQVYHDPNVLVGYDQADDGGVYRLDEERALVQTVDFFTPIVDDPYIYGQIAAANALSDIYAMGGTPRFALSIVGFPEDRLGGEILHDILRGGTDKMAEAKVAVIGGHSVQDKEIKFGYCVTGLVATQKIYSNAGLRAGDALLLTKPLGTGIIATGVKFDKASPAVAEGAIHWMSQLNAVALEQLQKFPVHSITDVTGFGLLGHAWEMATASGVTLVFQAASLPVMEGAEELASQGMLPGGIESNRKYVGEDVAWRDTADFHQQIMLDPQTSGGLLISLPEKEAESLSAELRAAGVLGERIGTVVDLQDTHIQVS
ncbi:MAG: selenide, water dikinase SelD [Acidobacteriota bacterium]